VAAEIFERAAAVCALRAASGSAGVDELEAIIARGGAQAAALRGKAT
jgi:hypothetical protein